jgi:hypothetical protein
MKRQVPGLAETARDSRPEIPDGIFLVRVDGAQFRWHAHKPFYVLRLSILEPSASAGQSIVGRLYCTQKAMWKLGWFLRDFLYDPELLAHEQVASVSRRVSSFSTSRLNCSFGISRALCNQVAQSKCCLSWLPL